MTLPESIEAVETARKLCRESREAYEAARKVEDVARLKYFEAARVLCDADKVYQLALAQSKAPKNAIPVVEASEKDARKEWLGEQ